MASTSSSARSSQLPQWKYDVFLSFRGADTRRNFTSHLYEGLKNRGIVTFLDDKPLERGDSIEEAIEESQVAVIIFSENYATSSWCLDELVKIMECKDKNGQIVIPIFYYVDPSHVRNQRESFAKAFAEHELKYEDDRVQGWRTALTAAASLRGYDVPDRIESECIGDLVDQISSKLCKPSLSYLKDIVGIDAHLEKVKSLLEMEINDVRIVGIWGMGGIGKTTIARALFDTLSSQFEAACFIADIKGNYCGTHNLQNILLSDLLREKANYVNNKEEGRHLIAHRFRFKKVLVVLDDIDHSDHLDYLAGNFNWFGNGSRIIATTRDKYLMGKTNVVYEVTTLLEHDAIQLFNQHAFKEEVPDECFEKLTLEVVSHAKGLPLALKVWGSFLYKRDIIDWRSFVHRIKNNCSSEIVERLKVSYDRLETIQQDIFLDIACFLRGEHKGYVMSILESCYFGASIELSVLIDKSLVFISEYDTIQMHDLIQAMGKYIVKMEKDLGERSRIWDAEDFKEVMDNNSGTNTEAIWLEGTLELCFSKKDMKNMKRLRILHIHDGVGAFDDFIEYLPNNLRYFGFYWYPGESLPENFKHKRLVHLNLQCSSRHLWIGTKHFPSLRCLDLCESDLRRTPDFTGMPNLEYLDLSLCRSLEEVHPSLKCCGKLIRLNLLWCESLKRFPYVNVESLEYLDLQDCSSLEKFPEFLGRMKPELEIKMDRSGIRELPSSIFQPQTHLTELHLNGMRNLVALPSSICKLKGLVKLYVSCPKLKSLPEEIGDLQNLEELHARGTLISRPPPSIVRLNKLKCLDFEKKSEDGVLFVFPQVNEGLRSLEILNLSWCNLIDGGLPEDIGCLSSLKYLNLRCCDLIDGGLPEDIGCLSSLEELDLGGNDFEHLPRSISQLGALRTLELSDCPWLTQLPDFTGMPNLETLYLSKCINLEEVHPSLGFLKKLCKLELTNCKHLKRFPSLCINSLEYLNLKGCSSLEIFPEILGSMNLELRSGIKYLDLSSMENLVTLPSSICKLKGFVKLYLRECSKLESLPEEIGDLENLEELDARWTLISRPPSSIVRLNKLKLLSFEKQKSEDGVYFVFPQVNEGLRSLEELNLSYCNLIDGGLPEDIGCLSSLKVLKLRGNNFEHLPRSIAQLGALRSLDLEYCERLKQLPEFPEQLHSIDADWRKDWICNSLFQNISSLQHDISASDSLSLRLFNSSSVLVENIPSWFHYRGTGTSVSVNLPENWYVSDNFLGFAVCYNFLRYAACYSGRLIDITAHLIPLCDDGMSSMIQKFALSNQSQVFLDIHFFLVPFAVLWDTSKANGKTPNDYGHIILSFPEELKGFGLRLLYKDEPELDVSCNDEPKEHHDEASSSSCNDEPTEHCIGIRWSTSCCRRC